MPAPVLMSAVGEGGCPARQPCESAAEGSGERHLGVASVGDGCGAPCSPLPRTAHPRAAHLTQAQPGAGRGPGRRAGGESHTHTHTHACTHIHVHTRTHCSHVYTDTCTSTHTCMHTYIRTQTHAHKHICAVQSMRRTRAYIHTHTCTCAGMHMPTWTSFVEMPASMENVIMGKQLICGSRGHSGTRCPSWASRASRRSCRGRPACPACLTGHHQTRKDSGRGCASWVKPRQQHSL